jgi:hypothetical protein
VDKLFNDDTKSSYFSDGNIDFLQETGAIKNMSYNDGFLRPSFVSNCYYDIMFGSKNVETTFKYDLNYRNYYVVTQGSINVKLSPPKSSKYLYQINDYDNFEFKSHINPWNPQPKYKADFDKIKCLEIILTPGKILHIPAFWWYTFKFNENTSVSCFKYRTYMNNIAISPNIFLYALQSQNIEHKIAKRFDINKKNINETNTTTIINTNENVNATNINTTNIDINTTNINDINTTNINDINTTNVDDINATNINENNITLKINE